MPKLSDACGKTDIVIMQACAVMALERVPADIRAAGGVARMVSFADCFYAQIFGWNMLTLSTERPLDDQADRRGCDNSCHGQGPYRALCRGSGGRQFDRKPAVCVFSP